MRAFWVLLGTVLMTVLSAFCYRVGGMSKKAAKAKFPWLPSVLVNTKFRDLGCSLVMVVWMILFMPVVGWWVHLLGVVWVFGGLTTYWDDLFGYDNFYMHGGMIALGYLPYAIYLQVVGTPIWIGLLVRIIVVALFMGLWCKFFSSDDVEEFGRGGVLVASLPFMLIGV